MNTKGMRIVCPNVPSWGISLSTHRQVAARRPPPPRRDPTIVLVLVPLRLTFQTLIPCPHPTWLVRAFCLRVATRRLGVAENACKGLKKNKKKRRTGAHSLAYGMAAGAACLLQLWRVLAIATVAT